MKSIYVALAFVFPLFLSAQDFAQTITSKDFEQDGSELVIWFDIPQGEAAFSYNLHSAKIYDKDYKEFEVRTVKGDRQNLRTGSTYQLRWEVLKDLDEFYAPKKAEINLEYTIDSELLAREKELLEQKEREAKAAQELELRKKAERKKKKPFSVGFMGYGGYVHGLLGDADEDITSEVGYGIGAGVFLEKRVGDGWYFQFEGSYQQRRFYFSNTGSNVEYNYTTEVYYDTKKANFDFRDYRLYARLKFKNFFYVGGYYAWFQRVERKGEQNLDVVYPDQPWLNQSLRVPDLRYSLLDGQLHAPDQFGNQPIQNDYGVTLGVETPSFKNIVFSLGYDLSLGNILNDNYWRRSPTDNTDLYPTQDVRLRLGYLYARFGLRI